MDLSKRLNLNNIFVFLFLVLFPFGQIIRIGILQPIDMVVGFSAVYSIVKKLKKPDVFKYLNHFLFFAFVSWVFSIFIFPQIQVLYGLLYLFRLASYIYFYLYIGNFINTNKNNGDLLLKSLLALAVISAFFGWIQYFTVPDIKPFIKLGWDMHLMRLVGTFLDPVYLSLLIVFGSVISISRYLQNYNRKYLFITLFFIVSLAFTYSRAGYLAFVAAIGVISFYKKAFGQLLLIVFALLLLVYILPTAKNKSLEIFRSFSAISRIENYSTTLKIFAKSPVFGIGYDNMCLANNTFIRPQKYSSHACSGSDSSLLFILATTGVAGFIVFVYSLAKIGESLKHNRNYLIFVSSFAALLIHSLFSNSLVYPWILGWMIILLAEV